MIFSSKIIFTGIITLFMGLLFFCSLGKKIILVNDGVSSYSIIVNKNASPSERRAAEEFQHYIKEISDCTLPIKSDDGTSEAGMIFIGESKPSKQIFGSLDTTSLGEEGFVIKTKGVHLLLAGGKLRGTLYAVYTFLEETLGCRWYTSKINKIPRTKSIAISAVNNLQKPAFECRELFWTEAFDVDWAVRNKSNNMLARNYQTGNEWFASHSVYTLNADYNVLPKSYFEDHPEYFSLLAKKRNIEQPQPCLTNPELMKITLQNALEWFEKNPENSTFFISQNGWDDVCECGACTALDSVEESGSGSLVHFANGIAEKISKPFPQKCVGMLAMNSMEKPPKRAQPRDNVIVHLCRTLPSCAIHPIERCPVNRGFKQNLEKWSRIAKKIYITNYCINFAHYLLPFPNLDALKADIAYFHKMNVRGVFCEGDCAPGGGGELSELRAYVLAKLLWNPSENIDNIIGDFLDGYLAGAAKPVRKYISFLQETASDDNIHANRYSPPNVGYLTQDFIDQADDYFNQAERLTDNEEQLQRVRKLRLSVQYAKLAMPVPYVVSGSRYEPDPASRSLASVDELDKYLKLVEKYGITQLQENLPIEVTEQWIKMRKSACDIVPLDNSWIHVDVIPGLGGRISKIITKNNNWNLLKEGNINDDNYPASGGYTEISLSASAYVPFEYKYNTVAEGERIVMSATLNDFQRQGIAQMTRMITLLKDRPVLEIFTSLKCLQPYEQKFQVIASYNINNENSDSVTIGFAGNKNEMHPLPASFLRHSIDQVVYSGNSIAGGMWEIENPFRKIGLIDRFYPESIKECLVKRDMNGNSISLVMVGKSVPLAPGDRLAFRHLLEITEKPVQNVMTDSVSSAQSETIKNK